jgi:hypothetical protein
MFPFVERTGFTGVYRNEAGMFTAQLFLVVVAGQNGLTNVRAGWCF